MAMNSVALADGLVLVAALLACCWTLAELSDLRCWLRRQHGEDG